MKVSKIKAADIPSLMSEWDFEKNNESGIDPCLLGAQSNTYAFWRCKYGHSWKAKINNRYNGRGCPECSKRLKTSFPEQAVFFYIKKKFPDAINSYKDIFKNGMELDVYIPSMKTGIEYDGLAWHKNDSLEKERKKYQICKENGITLIRLKENREHYVDGLDVADVIILVINSFSNDKMSYHYLDKAIRELLHHFFDCDIYYGAKNFEEKLWEAVNGPRVYTDVNTQRDKNLIYENYLTAIEHNSLGEQKPEIAKLWHPTLNGELTPFMFSPHSSVRVWWKGKCGHEWDNPISSVSNGQGCPYCSGQRVLKGFNDLATINPDIAKQWHPTLNGDKKPDMFTHGSGHKAFWLCPICHQSWSAHINNRTGHNRGCPFCAHEKPIKGVNDLVTLRPDLMKEWNYEKNIKIDPTNLMPSSNKRVFWKCSVCGYEYKAYVNNRNKGTGCKRCAGQVLIPGVNDLQTLFPNVAAEWDFELNNITPNKEFPSSNRKRHWICKLGHKWETTTNARTSGKGCPFCSGNKVLLGFNDIATTHPEIAKLWHPTLNGDLLPTQVSKGHRDKIWLKCDICGKDYDARIPNIIKGFGKCPYCFSKGKTRMMYVYCVETKQYFKTLKEAGMSIGKEDIRQIQMCCKGRCKTAGGYHWKYVDKKD